jgi:hypothetical protein
MAIAENESAVGTFSFTVILEGLRDTTQELEDRLFEAGCDDALLCRRDGVVYLAFDRDSDSLAEAVGSALRDIASAGCTPAKILLGDSE